MQGNPAPTAADFDAAEARLRASVNSDLPILAVVRQATDVLSWVLCQSDLPKFDEDPVPASHLVATALLFLGVMAHRATRAAMALAATGYEPETLGLKRLLTEAHSRMKAILEDASAAMNGSRMAGSEYCTSSTRFSASGSSPAG